MIEDVIGVQLKDDTHGLDDNLWSLYILSRRR